MSRPKYWSFSISPSNEYSGLISFRINWFDLLAVQGTRKSLLQHHSSKASILRCSAFFTVQLSHPYMTTAKTITLTVQTFVSKVMSLLFNMLSRFATAFLPRSKELLISWLQSLSTVLLEFKKMKSVTATAAAAAKSLQSCPTLCDPKDGSPHPWDSPGKNTGVGCHFLLQCMKVKSQSEVAQSCPTAQRPRGRLTPPIKGWLRLPPF